MDRTLFGKERLPSACGTLPVRGRLQGAQRFATDWGKFDQEWRLTRAQDGENSDLHIYGQRVVAVADATVARIVEGIADNDPNAPASSLPNTIDTLFGNYVVLDLGDGHFAMYAHLQPGSLKVKRGDRVKRG